MTLLTGFTCPPTIYLKFITECDKCYYKVGQVLQSVTILLQSATVQTLLRTVCTIYGIETACDNEADKTLHWFNTLLLNTYRGRYPLFRNQGHCFNNSKSATFDLNEHDLSH